MKSRGCGRSVDQYESELIHGLIRQEEEEEEEEDDEDPNHYPSIRCYSSRRRRRTRTQETQGGEVEENRQETGNMVEKCPSGRDPPGSPWDYAFLAVAALAALPFIGANLVIATRLRRRPYIIAQGGAPLILLSSTSSFLWLVSTFVTLAHIPHNHFALLRACILWSLWLGLAFGLCLWLISLILRLHRLYLLGVSSPGAYSDNPHRTWTLHLPLLWAPTLVFVATATGLHASRMSGDNVCADCHLSNAWKWLSSGVLSMIYFLILLFLLFKLKNCKDYMVASEYKCTYEFSLKALLCTLLYGVTIVTGSDKTIAGRCFVSFCVCCVVYVHFWVRMGLPVYLYLFKGEPQLDSFEEELLCCGAECFYKIGSSSSHSPERVSFPAQDADWILRATSAAMLELSECKYMSILKITWHVFGKALPNLE